MASCRGDAPGWVGSPAWSSTLGVGLLLGSGPGPGCRGLASEGGRAAPQPGLPGCACVCACVWVGGCVHICMHVCAHVFMRVYACVVTAGQQGASCPRTLWMLVGRGAGPPRRQAWNEDPESTPLLRAPLTLPGWDQTGGHCRGHRDPLTGPPTQGLRCSGSPGQPRPSQGKLPHPKRLLLVQLCAWLPGGFDWTERSCSLKGASETYQPDGPSISGQAMSIL